MCETRQQGKNEASKCWADNMKEGFRGLRKGSSLHSFILETITIGVEDNQSTYSGRVKSELMSRKRDSIESRVVEREKFPKLQRKSFSWTSSEVIDVVYLAGNKPPVVAGTYIPSTDLPNLMIWTVCAEYYLLYLVNQLNAISRTKIPSQPSGHLLMQSN